MGEHSQKLLALEHSPLGAQALCLFRPMPMIYFVCLEGGLGNYVSRRRRHPPGRVKSATPLLVPNFVDLWTLN